MQGQGQGQGLTSLKAIGRNKLHFQNQQSSSGVLNFIADGSPLR